MAGIAVDAVVIGGRETGTVGGRGAPAVPAAGTVAADAQVARAVEILFGDAERRPEHRVTTGITHRGAAPAGGRFVFRFQVVVAGMAVVALVRRLEITNLVGLGAGHLDFIGYDVRRLCGRDGESNGYKSRKAKREQRAVCTHHC